MINIRKASPTDEDVKALIAELDAYQLSIYPEESNHLDPADELANPNVFFVGAYNHDRIVGIGAIKYLSCDCPYGEIKRVYINKTGRGRGTSLQIMAALERNARERGVSILRLETGIHQPEAIGLYEKLGFRKRNRFGEYPDDPVSVFMEKILR
jgi:putative acetyltransferase